jgi:cytochrome P450
LARAPEVQKKAREEVLNLLGDEPEDVYPTTQDVKNMPYLDAIIKETLRLNPPISNTLVRIVGEDMDIEGVPIEKGSLVDVDAIATHLSSKNWENPKEFIPERFLGTHDPTSAKDGVSWIPFGYGSHHCLGMNFSLMEQRVFLSMFCKL